MKNIDKRPPTLLQQFTLQYAPQDTLPSNPAPKFIYILPNPDPQKLTLVTSPPLRTYDLSPVGFFNPSGPTSPKTTDSHIGSYTSIRSIERVTDVASGLEPVTKAISRVKHEEREVTRFVRTSEGHGVGVIRAGGFGDVWRIAERGEERGCLVHVGNFEDTDFVVVLDQGKDALLSCTALAYEMITRMQATHLRVIPPRILS